MRVVTLRPGRDASVRRRHPWVFSGAVARVEGDGSDGLVAVHDSAGTRIGAGFDSGGNSLIAKLWTMDDEDLDDELIRHRFETARQLREPILRSGTTGLRLLHAEGDRTPGLVADRYGDCDVLLFTAAGLITQQDRIVRLYRAVFRPGQLVQRCEVGKQRGARADGDPASAGFSEHGLTFVADLADGQKTGFFLDQRENRRRLRELAAGVQVLNLFSYSGAFSVSALAGGARRAVDVDSSAAALALARHARRDNGFPVDERDFVQADVFTDLRHRVAAGELWDVVVCDPPAFAKKRGDVDRATRGYKDVLRLSMTLVRPGGLLLACSCSGHISPDLFQKVTFAAALDSGTDFQLLRRTGAGIDHPVDLYCPESEYLKALFLRRTG